MKFLALVRNESLKTWHRPAFWVGLVSFVCLMAAMRGVLWYSLLSGARTMPRLPYAWPNIIAGPAQLAALFAAITVILLTSAEFTWGTARQSVINGFSRGNVFSAKVLLSFGLAAVFMAAMILVGAAFAVPGTISAGGSLVRSSDAALMGGTFLSMIGYGSLGIVMAFMIRSSGPAVSGFFLYMLVEQVAGEIVGGYARALLPTAVFERLHEPAQFYSAHASAVVGEPEALNPAVGSTWVLLSVAGAYIGLMLGGSFLAFRRRDL